MKWKLSPSPSKKKKSAKVKASKSAKVSKFDIDDVFASPSPKKKKKKTTPDYISISSKKKTKRILKTEKKVKKRLSIGKAKIATADKNCLTCAFHRACKDPSKSYRYRCSNFSNKQEFDWSQFSEKGAKRQVKAREYSDETSEEFDINKIIDSIVETETGIPRDLKVDDRDVPLAKNFCEFLTSPKFLDFRPWAKQLEIGLNFFTDYCHNPKCTDVKYMKNVPVGASIDDILEHCTLFEHGICPKCKETRLDAWTNRKAGRYNQLAGLAGQRSSKSMTVGLMFGYHKHRFLKLPNPALVFGVLPNTQIHSTVTATTHKQAKESLYDPIADLVSSSPWFKSYHEVLDHYGAKYGEELYKLRTEFIQYRHKNFLFYAAAPDKKNLRGRTRIAAAIDEIGWMFAKSEDSIKLDPDEVYTAVSNSMQTLNWAYNRIVESGQFNVPSPIFCNISSPSSATDKIVRLVREAETNKTIFSFHYSVFEMNPTVKPADLEDIERANPEAFKRDFLAVPPDTTNAFINNKEALLGCIDKMQRNLTKVTQVKAESATGIPMVAGTLKIGKTNQHPPRILALDAGHTNNSFAGAILSFQQRDKDDEIEYPVVEGVFEIVPDHGYHINIPNVYEEVITPIIEDLNIKVVVADRWNSLKMLQDIEDEFGISWFQYSVTYQDMVQFRTDIYNGHVTFPIPEMKLSEAFTLANRSKNYPHCFLEKPVSHFLLQALTVEDILGKKVDKSHRRTDDIFRAVALGHAFMNDDEVRNNYLVDIEERTGPLSIGAVGSYGNMTRMAAGNQITNLGVIGGYKPTGTSTPVGGGLVFSRGR